MGLSTAFPFEFGFFRFPGKKSKEGSSPFMYLQSQSVVDGHIVLQDPSWLEERGLLYVCVSVFLAISPKKCGAGCWEFYLNGDQGSSYGPAGDGF